MARAETLGQTGRMEGDHAQLLLRSWRSPGGIWAQVQEWWGSALSALGTSLPTPRPLSLAGFHLQRLLREEWWVGKAACSSYLGISKD